MHQKLTWSGGGIGLGKAIAEKLFEDANVLIASRRAPSMPNVVSIVWDVRKVAATAKQKFGGTDILINNTGLGVTSKIVDCSEENWHQSSDMAIGTPALIAPQNSALPASPKHCNMKCANPASMSIASAPDFFKFHCRKAKTKSAPAASKWKT